MDSSYEDNEPSLHTGEFVPLTGDIGDDDTFKILVASDIHLGYCDDNPMREDDSFNTFEEILQLALSNEVDFLLLGGDLFHENKPRPNVLRRATELCRKYCLGDRPIGFQYVGQPERDFPNQTDPEVNYYNPNINVALPVFTIHGNHDDPIGTTKVSAVDHLAAAKLINHFGQWNNLNQVTVSPVLFVKGETKLAMYGLGYMKDERLHRLMLDKKVQFVGPAEDSNSWFNIFVLHQNRVKHGPKNYIPENFIPGYMDLVVWGHEHECKNVLDIAEGLEKTKILQPGSPVATSLCGGEAKDKHVFVLHINRRRFRKEAIPLQTVRPFVMKDIVAKEVFEKLPGNANAKERSKYLEKYLENHVKSMIEEAEDKLTGHEKQPVKPLIRIRVFHDDADETFHPVRFSQRFSEKVANDDIVMFKKKPIKREAGSIEIDADEIGELMMHQDDDDLDSHVEAIVENYFAKAREEGKTETLLEVLSERGISEAVKCAVEKDDDKAIQIVIENQVEKAIEYLIQRKVTEATVDDHLAEFRERRREFADQEKSDLDSILSNIRPNTSRRTNGNADEEMDELDNEHGEDSPPEIVDDDDDDFHSTASSRRGRGGAKRGARGGRGSRGGSSTTTKGRGRGRGKAASSSRDDDEDSTSPPPSTSSSTRARGGATRGKSTAKRNTSVVEGKTMVQTTLDIRRSPRKASGTGSKSKRMQQFDSDSD